MAKKAKAVTSNRPDTDFHEDPVSYKQFPKLAAYIDRIGASESTFRRFIVKEERARAYYIERCIIRINRDAEISVTNKDYAPTKEEAEEIQAELIKHTFPTTAHFTEAQIPILLKRMRNPKAEGVYFFASRAKATFGQFLFAQQRVHDKELNEKRYMPWTFWSDGQFRRMEPDDGLPFWKPYKGVEPNNEGGRKIMIHEGAKTAAFVDALVKADGPELTQHPYGEVFKEFEHWGLIGGALAPQRAIYEELHKEKPKEVFYVCDNDYAGISALKEISRNYKGTITGVVFDKKWPGAFDFADPMPKHLFNKKGDWIGPTWHDLLRFATWATELMPNPSGKGRPIPRISYNFREEWWHCVTPTVYIHKNWPANVLNEPDFNNHVQPFSDVQDTARLVKSENASKTAILSYQPHLDPGIYAADGGNFINTHVGPRIAPRADISPKPFLDFMEHLIPGEEDRRELLRWIATIIARPDLKMSYGVLLVSEVQGIGKSTLGEKILAPLMGQLNVSYPSETEIVDSNFNEWAAHKRLAVVHEIYAGHSAKAYNKLKSLITDRDITVNKKYQASYRIDNWMHMLACSNSPRALQLSHDDRRWYVPRVTDKKKSPAFWQELNDWLSDGLGLNAILAWAQDFLKHNKPVLKGEDAPGTEAKFELVEDTYSQGMELVKATLEAVSLAVSSEDKAAKDRRATWERNGQLKDGVVILVDRDFQEVISRKLYEGRQNDRLERPHTIRRVAKAQPGWYVSKEPLPYKGWGQARFKGRLITNSSTVAELPLSKLPDGLKPLDLTTLTEL